MREAKCIAARPPRVLVPVITPVTENFDLADKEITVDGESIRLGDWWHLIRLQAAMTQRGDA